MERRSTREFYLIHLVDGIEPTLMGPYGSSRYRDKKAQHLHTVETGENDIVLWLNAPKGAAPKIGTYSGGFLAGRKGFSVGDTEG
jgi:hypothetical protein